MKSYIFLLAAIMVLGGTACKKVKQDTSCDGVICTLNFAFITADVQYTNTKPVVLDDYYTIRVSTGDTIRFNNQLTPGLYTVLDDSYLVGFQNQEGYFRFVGIKGNKMVVNEVYLLSADCCHVNRKAGNQTVIVQ